MSYDHRIFDKTSAHEAVKYDMQTAENASCIMAEGHVHQRAKERYARHVLLQNTFLL